MLARSSGERLAFIQGCAPPDCAVATESIRLKSRSANARETLFRMLLGIGWPRIRICRNDYVAAFCHFLPIGRFRQTLQGGVYEKRKYARMMKMAKRRYIIV